MFERSTGFFGLRSWPDYAFFVVVILWGLAALFFMYPPEGGFGGDRAESVAGSMVDSSVANEIDSERFHQTRYFVSNFLFQGYLHF
ncbi:hypothetical protein VCSRO130_3598 [Vibrio cholerae]|nr:hypothetical protein VCSRO130_3598 [Vibrio cholerae]